MPVLRVGRLRLHPGALLITLLAIAIMVKLGFWQIDRGQEKQSIIDNHAIGVESEAQRLNPDTIYSSNMRTDEVVRARGSFRENQYFLVDNQTFNGRVGYHVVALLESEAIDPFLLPVNLGWVSIEGSRQTLPEVSLPAGEVEIEGRVHVPAEKPFLLGEQAFSDELPMRVQYLELEKLKQHLQLPLTDFSVLLDEEADFGFPRDWPVVVMEPHRHYAYAVQWFGLAIAALVIFLVASRVKSKAKEKYPQ
ncbi:hypothetical protein CWE09_08840 [Aliidiomarina minuta]|uniref:SURF1-like protein n=1 Tax=Aliidiomarina minuta TaxID=880057 RepID=A0A432W9F2_9GAMM|nr:SURF1 family protein [Aliidiomarina minuta]RUO26783.1 hypothetical protein CWE09_08840 [Aliidiomarina minuta]